ncbi:hypothetical protein E8E68_25525 [Pseudomonas sp. BN607]|nr:hypothetical protein [Pseudomonas sp. BN607]
MLAAAAADDQNFHVKTSIQVIQWLAPNTVGAGLPANAAVNPPSYSRASPLPQDLDSPRDPRN